MIKIRAREREQECLPKTYECYAYKTGFESAIETVDKNLLIGAKITICHNAASTSAGFAKLLRNRWALHRDL